MARGTSRRTTGQRLPHRVLAPFGTVFHRGRELLPDFRRAALSRVPQPLLLLEFKEFAEILQDLAASPRYGPKSSSSRCKAAQATLSGSVQTNRKLLWPLSRLRKGSKLPVRSSTHGPPLAPPV